MKRKLDGAGVGSHVNRPLIAGLALDILEPATPDPALSAEIIWTKAAHKRSAESRQSRIARAAYFLSEARGFEPGHDEEDWLLAQMQVDALDAGVF